MAGNFLLPAISYRFITPKSGPHGLHCWLIAGAILVAPQASNAAQDQLRVVIVGGGPSKNSNQAAIESNVRYVTKLLPKKNVTSTFFADGNPQSPTVIYHPETAPKSTEEDILAYLLATRGNKNSSSQTVRTSDQPSSPEKPAALVPQTLTSSSLTPDKAKAHADVPNSKGSFKVPGIKRIDGPSRKESIEGAFTQLLQPVKSTSPIFLYFTGHGSKTKDNKVRTGFR